MADQQMAFSGFAVSTAVRASATRLGLSLNERDAISVIQIIEFLLWGAKIEHTVKSRVGAHLC